MNEFEEGKDPAEPLAKAGFAYDAGLFGEMAKLLMGELSRDHKITEQLARLSEMCLHRVLTALRLLMRKSSEFPEERVGDFLREYVLEKLQEDIKPLFAFKDVVEARLISGKQLDGYSLVFLHKTRGDLARYLAEFCVDVRFAYIDTAAKAYAEASDFAETALRANDPLRLGLALNFAVFKHSMLNETGQALKILERLFAGIKKEDAEGTQPMPEKSWKILKVIKQNIEEWSAKPK